ncbi:MAG: HPr family phosphocarrier protein [Chromatiales bacterium]
MMFRNVRIINKLGLHARAAARLVQLASRFQCEVKIRRNGKEVNGKSIMGVMMLAAHNGAEIEILASGPDERQAIASLEDLVANKFGESE